MESGELAARVGAGEARAVARLISWVEDGAPGLPDALAALPAGPPAYVIGLTGSPGVGKSTVTSALVAAYRARGQRVGVLAIDPSSPFTGGALLGDRIRMQEHATDPGVFIRSMASRGHLGGMAAATPQAVRVLEAAGCAVVLIETVGVGQSEVDVAATADATMLRLGAPSDGWMPPVVTSSAARGEINDLLGALDDRRAWLDEGDHWLQRRRQRAAAEILALAGGRARILLVERLSPEVIDEVAEGRLSSFAAADGLLAER